MVYELMVYDFEYCHGRADRRMNNSRPRTKCICVKRPEFSARSARAQEQVPFLTFANCAHTPLSARTDKEAPS